MFNPSLITPNYGINNRQPVNPPNPDVSDVDSMTNLILSGIGGMINQQSKRPEETQKRSAVTRCYMPTNKSVN